MSEFDESKHPRDDKGRFSEGGGGAGLSAFANAHAGNGTKTHSFAAYSRAKNPEKHAEMSRVMGEFKGVVNSGKLTPGVSLGTHVKIAKDTLAKHNEHFKEGMAELKKHAPADAKIEGRTKELHSAIEKLIRKEKYGTVDKLQDATGLRVIANSLQKVKETVDRIKADSKVVAEDNYIAKPLGDYRSHHLIVEDKHGLQKEIQVRTENQHSFANWAHDVYKPHNEAQRAALEKHGDVVAAYSKAISEHFWKQDNGQKSTRPATPEIIKKHFGEPV